MGWATEIVKGAEASADMAATARGELRSFKAEQKAKTEEAAPKIAGWATEYVKTAGEMGRVLPAYMLGGLSGGFGQQHGIESSLEGLTPEQKERIRGEMGIGTGTVSGLGGLAGTLAGAGLGAAGGYLASRLGVMRNNRPLAMLAGAGLGSIGGSYLGGRLAGGAMTDRAVGQELRGG